MLSGDTLYYYKASTHLPASRSALVYVLLRGWLRNLVWTCSGCVTRAHLRPAHSMPRPRMHDARRVFMCCTCMQVAGRARVNVQQVLEQYDSTGDKTSLIGAQTFVLQKEGKSRCASGSVPYCRNAHGTVPLSLSGTKPRMSLSQAALAHLYPVAHTGTMKPLSHSYIATAAGYLAAQKRKQAVAAARSQARAQSSHQQGSMICGRPRSGSRTPKATSSTCTCPAKRRWCSRQKRRALLQS